MVSDHAVRYAYITANTFLNILLFFLSTFLIESLTLFMIQILALGSGIIYIAAAVIPPALKEKRGAYDPKGDRAWGEGVYLGIQWSLWMASTIMSAYNAGQSQCDDPSRYRWAIEWPDLVWNGFVTDVGLFCRSMVAMAVLSAVHVVIIGAWFGWVVGLKRRAGPGARVGWGGGMRQLIGGLQGGLGHKV